MNGRFLRNGRGSVTGLMKCYDSYEVIWRTQTGYLIGVR